MDFYFQSSRCQLRLPPSLCSQNRAPKYNGDDVWLRSLIIMVSLNYFVINIRLALAVCCCLYCVKYYFVLMIAALFVWLGYSVPHDFEKSKSCGASVAQQCGGVRARSSSSNGSSSLKNCYNKRGNKNCTRNTKDNSM